MAMARFANDCLVKLHELIDNRLEPTLGSDTQSLDLRVGLHSGPVTAGVLRGERSRFQLFGDTVNTTSRMETTGLPGHIQISEDTANLLIESGKQRWVQPRPDLVEVKGKGQMRTYWLTVMTENNTSASSDPTTCGDDAMIEEEESAKEKMDRLINWNVDIFVVLLQKTAAYRVSREDSVATFPPTTCTPYQDLRDTIHFPEQVSQGSYSPSLLDPAVSAQLLHFVQTIASLYDNSLPFHNFEHASHVTMSMHHLLNRVNGSLNCFDPLTQLALHVAALIHDIGHTGVANLQLAKEKPDLAQYYGETGLAEQYSLDLAWSLLQNDEYEMLRQAMYVNEEEQRFFRQVLARSVLATDITNTKCQKEREERWQNAFVGSVSCSIQEKNVKLTLLLDIIIQAADISPLMQHWSVYLKWNERLFAEMKAAFTANRFPKDPSLFWVKGELGFFDNVVIPLASKLKEAGISNEYLLMAIRNREEWNNNGARVFATSSYYC